MAIQTPVAVGTVNGASSTTHVLTVPAGGVPVGALLIVEVLWQNASFSTASCADSKGNSYTNDNPAGAAPSRVACLSAVVGTALVSGDTITVTLSLASPAAVSVFYALPDSGWAWDSTRLDKASAGSNLTSQATWITNSVATTQADELAVAISNGGSETFSSTPVGSGVEVHDIDATNPARRLVTQYQILTATNAAFTMSGTWSTAAASLSICTTYKPVSTVVPQKIRPDADIDTTGWATAPLWSKIDEDVAGGDVITATAS